MHYNSLAFTKNGQLTIIPRDGQYTDVIGQRYGLSDGDIKRINIKYKCNAIKPFITSTFAKPIAAKLISKPEYNIISTERKKPAEVYSKFRSYGKSFGSGWTGGLSSSQEKDELDELFNL